MWQKRSYRHRLTNSAARLSARRQKKQCPYRPTPRSFSLAEYSSFSLLATLYAAAEIVWPLVFAFMISLLLNPLLRVLTRLHVPRVLCALLLVVVVLALVVGLGTAISGPATSWAAKLPDGVPRLLQRLRFLEVPFSARSAFLATDFGLCWMAKRSKFVNR